MNNFEEEKAKWLEDYLIRRKRRGALYDELEYVHDFEDRSKILDEIIKIDDGICMHDRSVWGSCFACDLIEYALRKEGKISGDISNAFDNYVENMIEIDPAHLEWLEEEYGKQRGEVEAAAKRAKELGRGLVVQADLDAVKGMKLPEACDYVKEKNLRLQVFSIDGCVQVFSVDSNKKEHCTDVINVDLVGGIIVNARACNLKK